MLSIHKSANGQIPPPPPLTQPTQHTIRLRIPQSRLRIQPHGILPTRRVLIVRMGIINAKIPKRMHPLVKQGKDGQDGIPVDFDISGQWLERWEGWKDGRMEG